MNEYVAALIIIAAVAVLAYLAGLLFESAERRYALKRDPRRDDIKKLLPSENCGVCGYVTCEEYAQALLDGEAPSNKCIIGADEVSRKISEYLNIPFEKTVRLRAQVMCSGTNDISNLKYKYVGLDDCMSVFTLGNGPKECPYGCIGLGTCVHACPFQAIKVENGVAVVEYEKCRACGVCVTACPQNIIRLIPFDANVWVGCSSRDKSSDLRKYCTVGCVGCYICENTCPESAIKVEDNVAKIDYKKCTNCGICVDKCPRGILWRGDRQILNGDTITSAKQSGGEEK